MHDQINSKETLLTLTADIVAAHVGNNSVVITDVPTLIANVHGALTALTQTAPVVEEVLEPAVAIRSSIKPDHVVCLEDGKKMKMLKRHLMTHHNLTPEEYRARWGLPASYPMVAQNYTEVRRSLALQMGLGKVPGAKRPKK